VPRHSRVLLSIAASVALVAGGAAAQPLLSAQTPSHNIFCIASPPGQDAPTASLRCDILHKATRNPRAPRSCPLSWGDAFGLNPTGAAYLVCHGDTTRDADDTVIAYGAQWRPYGFVCTSQPTGFTCVNGEGHGFSISRGAQKTF
jgi:hypothetical protein